MSICLGFSGGGGRCSYVIPCSGRLAGSCRDHTAGRGGWRAGVGWKVLNRSGEKHLAVEGHFRIHVPNVEGHWETEVEKPGEITSSWCNATSGESVDPRDESVRPRETKEASPSPVVITGTLVPNTCARPDPPHSIAEVGTRRQAKGKMMRRGKSYYTVRNTSAFSKEVHYHFFYDWV